MSRTFPRTLAVALVLAGAACADQSSTAPQVDTAALSGAFATMPLGYDAAMSTFDTRAGTAAWSVSRDRFGGGLMGGGLAGLFVGGGFGSGFGRGWLGDDIFAGTCAFNPATGRVECAPIKIGDSITILRSVAFTDASGQVQTHFDSLTDAIDTRVSVTGSLTRRDSAVVTFQSASERKVSGLLKSSTQRVINGASAGQETTVGHDSVGTFTAVRTIGDTTKNVVLPRRTEAVPVPFPTAGTIVRQMQATFTRPGKPPRTSLRREVITYDGSDTAQVVITHDGTTRTCVLPLPWGRLKCQ